MFIYSFIKTHSSSDMSYKYSSPVCLHVPNSVFRINVFHFYKTQGIIFPGFFFSNFVFRDYFCAARNRKILKNFEQRSNILKEKLK